MENPTVAVVGTAFTESASVLLGCSCTVPTVYSSDCVAHSNGHILLDSILCSAWGGGCTKYSTLDDEMSVLRLRVSDNTQHESIRCVVLQK